MQQGKQTRFESTLLEALEQSRWCSSDPLCIESKGQGMDSLNLGACHSCALLPETACETMNSFLDRGLVTGTPENAENGIFLRGQIMAVMIPDFVHPDCKSNAEKYLFDRLKKELDKNYIVMHSLGLARHGRNFSSEIDFLIVSQRGLLVLEVKGGRVRHEMGVWYFTNRYDETDSRRRSPMQQAREAMYALRANIWESLR